MTPTLMFPDSPTYRVAVSRYPLDRKIPLGDPFWSKFNASFEKKQIASVELASLIYDGHPFTTWHKNNWRNNANYECGQHIGLDFDTEDSRSTLTGLASDAFIKKYASIIYTTPSHTPEKPRARVVFLLDTPIMQAHNYSLGVQALLWLCGTADRQCKEPCRFFYGSQGCDMELPDNVLPLTRLKLIIEDYKEAGRRAMQKQRNEISGTTDQGDVIEALRRIPPWGIEYDDWVRVLMAIHSEYGDGGLTLAEQWADGKPGEVERKWRSFANRAHSADSVTIATLFGIAKQYGWQKAA
jgi:hypothetical protein